MKEQWIKWKPINDLPSKPHIDFILDKRDFFEIVLANPNNENKKIIITFEDSVESYRLIDESYVQETLLYLNKVYGRGFYGDWSFFKVENSRYLKSLSEESGSLSDYMDFTHYVLILEDAMIDIINRFEPIVTMSTS